MAKINLAFSVIIKGKKRAKVCKRYVRKVLKKAIFNKKHSRTFLKGENERNLYINLISVSFFDENIRKRKNMVYPLKEQH